MQRFLALLASLALSFPASAALFGPTPYSSFSDSPFSGLDFDYFHLETFDDHALNTPGVTATGGSTASFGFNGSVIDQVGSEGGCPAGGLTVACDTWFFSPGNVGVQFVFSAAILGQLPNAAGLVWTDGSGTIRFEAFDDNNMSLGFVTGDHADTTFFGTTDEDRFYGVTTTGGLSRIVITNSSGGIEVDHLQYGAFQAQAVAEPAILWLLGVALAGVGFVQRRLMAGKTATCS